MTKAPGHPAGVRSMTESEYLAKVLEAQTLPPGGDEISALQSHRQDVESLLRKAFGSSPTIRYGGSMAKGTMIRESYDLDILCYFPRDDEDAGGTLIDIYESVEGALEAEYQVQPKTSAIRILAPEGDADFHIDVVPGRFVDGEDGDVFLYQAEGEKERLKTNIDVHVAHVKNSGVIPAIRLMKFWVVLQDVGIKTFVLELLVIDLLKSKRKLTLPDQLRYVLTQFRDAAESLRAEDPANPQGNDLSDALDSVRLALSQAAGNSLAQLERSGWSAIFGNINAEDEAWKTVAIRSIVESAEVRPKPYCDG